MLAAKLPQFSPWQHILLFTGIYFLLLFRQFCSADYPELQHQLAQDMGTLCCKKNKEWPLSLQAFSDFGCQHQNTPPVTHAARFPPSVRARQRFLLMWLQSRKVISGCSRDCCCQDAAGLICTPQLQSLARNTWAPSIHAASRALQESTQSCN